MNQPDLLQLHQVTRQLPLILPECRGLHAEVELDCSAGVGLLRQRRVGQLRAGANLLSGQQPEGDEGPGEEVVDVEVRFQITLLLYTEIDTAKLYLPLTFIE